MKSGLILTLATVALAQIAGAEEPKKPQKVVRRPVPAGHVAPRNYSARTNPTFNRNNAQYHGNAVHNYPVQNRAVIQNRNVYNRNIHNNAVTNRYANNRIAVNNGVNRWNRGHTWNFNQARSHFIRERHDRGWWRGHYNRFVLFGGGYYYWNAGYWYPAYGYDPAYSSYGYDGPIYGYNDLPPDRILYNVQSALQQQGYYDGAIDGDIGPQTRRAIANYQRDQGLEVTAAVDGPTLQSLGLV